jgi:hypothetical protein
VNIAKINNTCAYFSVNWNEKKLAFGWSKVSNEPDYSTLTNYIENCFSNGSDIIITSNMFDNKVSYSREKLRNYMDLMFSILMLSENRFLCYEEKVQKNKIN